MTIAILAVQGAFLEQEQTLDMLGVNYFEIRQRPDLDRPFDGLILPGGESTVQGKLLRELDLFDVLKEKIESGLPVLATCAGMILLAGSLADDDTVHFGTMPIRVRRNAYGRQLGSFHTTADMAGIGSVPMTFIRAPYVESVEGGAEVLARVDGNIVAVKYNNQLALSFHPELDRAESTAIHEAFFKMIVER